MTEGGPHRLNPTSTPTHPLSYQNTSAIKHLQHQRKAPNHDHLPQPPDRPPPVTLNLDSVVHALRFSASYDPPYVQRQARAMLNRILGPGWRAWPTSRPAQTPLSPAQRKQFHLHPVPILLSSAGDLLLLEQEDGPEEEDDPL